MILERRDFLKLLGGSAGAVALGSCGRFSVPDRLVELALRGPGLESHVNTICGLCEGGCGLTVRLVDGLPVGLKGNPRHPMNRGGLCPVGLAGLEVLYAPNRLRTPMRRQPDGSFDETTWDEALDEVASRLADLIDTGKARGVALLNGEPGGLFAELGERFVRVLGSPRYFRSEAAAAIPFRLSQGLDQIPGFDLAGADLVLSVGLDLFEDGTAPLQAVASMVGSRRTIDRGRLIHVGSRLSPTATKADTHVGVRPGTHAAIALGIAHVLVREGRYDSRFVAEHTFGFEDWVDSEGRSRLGFRRLLLERYYPDRTALLAGCEPGEIIRVARRLARAEAPVAVCGGEAAGGVNATWTAFAVHALNALLGAFDRSGGVVLPETVPFTPLAPVPARLSSTTDRGDADGSSLFDAEPLRTLLVDGEIDVLFVVGTNPVHDSPLGDDLRRVLDEIPLVVVLAPFHDETAAHADLVLPSSSWLEKTYDSTTPPGVAFSVLGLSQPVVEPFFDSRHPGDTLLELARRVGDGVAEALPWPTYDAYLMERLQGLLVSGQGSVISGSFEESWVHFLEERGWRFLEHGDSERFRRDLGRAGGWWNPIRSRGDWQRLFATESGRFEFFSLEIERRLCDLAGETEAGGDRVELLRSGIEKLGLHVEGDEACLPHFEPPGEQGEGELTLVPFRPVTGRGSVGVNSPMLLEMYGYPMLSGWQTWVELAPETAHEQHLEEGDRVEVLSDRGGMEAIVKVEPGAMPGVAHVPLGLGRDELGGAAQGIGANPLALVLPDRDPISGVPATTSTRVRLRLLKKRARGGERPLSGGHG